MKGAKKVENNQPPFLLFVTVIFALKKHLKVILKNEKEVRRLILVFQEGQKVQIWFFFISTTVHLDMET